MSKVEILADSLKGPYAIFVDGNLIKDVENYDFYYDEETGAHYIKLKLVVHQFELHRKVAKENVKS